MQSSEARNRVGDDWHNHWLSTITVRIAGAALSFAFGILAARFLGIEDFGSLSVLLALTNVGVIVALLGHETLATREVAVSLNAERPFYQAWLYRQAASKQVWGTGLVVLAVLLPLVHFFPMASGLPTGMLLTLGLVPIVARARLAQGIIRGTHKTSLALLPDGVVRPTCAIAGMGAIWFLSGERSQFIGPVLIVAGLFGLIWALRWEVKVLGNLDRRCFVDIGQSGTSAMPNNISWAMYFSTLLGVCVSQFGILATAVLAEDAQAGMFAAAERFALATALVGQAIYLAIAPKLASAHKKGAKDELRIIVRRATRIVGGITLGLCGLLGAYATQAMVLYGQAFGSASPVLSVLLAAVLINSAAGPTGQLLLMTGNERSHFLALVFSIFVQAVVSIMLIPSYGALGAAFAVLISTSVWNIVMIVFVRFRLGLKFVLAWA